MEFAHQAERKAFSVAIDGALKHVKKDREKSFLQLIDLAEKFMDGDKLQKEDYDKARELVKNSEDVYKRQVMSHFGAISVWAKMALPNRL